MINPTNQQRIGISSCLLGNKVRYDGDHQLSPTIIQFLGSEFELISFCPEMDIGLGVPRAKIQLVSINDNIVCLDEQTHLIDYTEQLANSCSQQIEHLKTLSGYILKTKSPSCGITKVKTDFQGEIKAIGQGIFARKLLDLFPRLPVIEEDQFEDEILREKFVESVRGY